MTPREVIERARSQVGIGTKYRMGGGAHDHRAPDCRGEDGSCDCSALVAWVLGYRKYQPGLRHLGTEWLNTDGIVLDSDATVGLYSRIALAVPGCVGVYPKASVARRLGLAGQGPSVGHVGIVTAVKGGVATCVVHCSSGNYRATRDAIRETDAAVFERVAYSRYVWCATVAR